MGSPARAAVVNSNQKSGVLVKPHGDRMRGALGMQVLGGREIVGKAMVGTWICLDSGAAIEAHTYMRG